jgi:predicted nuclease with TOPRIM domain
MAVPQTNSIESLKARYDDLRSKKITAEANLKHASDTLGELRREALQQFGTDDVDALREKLREMEAENARLQEEYDKHLTQIETNLSEVETR